MPTRTASLFTALFVVLTGPVFAQSFGGGVMATTPGSGINSMATTPGLPPASVPMNAADKAGANTAYEANSGYQAETPPPSTPGDVVSKVPGEPPTVSSGISRQNDVTGQKKKKPTDVYSRPQQ